MTRTTPTSTVFDRAGSSRSCSGLFGLAALVALLALGTGCSGSDGGGSASVTIDSVSPTTTYPGVETSVEFSITPGDGVSASDVTWEVNFGDNASQTGEGTSGSVTHAWEQSGQYTLEVIALSGGTEVGSTTRRLEVLVPIDLAISNIQPRPRNVEAGESFQAVFDVENLSPTDVNTPFGVDVYLLPPDQTSATPEDVADLTRLGSKTLEASDGEAVVPGSDKRRVGVQTKLPEDTASGDYKLVVFANPEGQFADENPDDNLQVSDAFVRVAGGGLKPDVAVENVYAVNTRAYPALNEFSRGFTLRNRGGSEAAEVSTTTYLSVGDDEIDDSDPTFSNSDQTYDIPPGETKEVGPDQFVLDEDITPSNGEKTVYIIVEATIGSGQDGDDENNVGVSDPPITVSDKLADGPDIAVEKFSATPQKTYLNGSVDVSMTVANRGTEETGPFICRLYLGEEPRVDMTDTPIPGLNIPNLASDESQKINKSITVPGTVQPGTYYLYTVCDPNGSLDENFRSNNQKIYQKPLEVTDEADVDLFVDTLAVPKTAEEGDEVTLTASVCVTGSNASGTTRGALYQTTGTQVDFEQEPMKTFEIPNVNPGACKDVELTVTADCEDFEENYAYGVVVDTQDQLPEQDEMNNRKRGENLLQIQGEFCKCTEDNFEPNDKPREAYTLGSGTTSGAVCEAGSCDYYGVTLEESESLRVETTFEADKGALKTTLFDPSGVTSLDSDATDGRQRVATFNVPNDATYIYRVCGAKSTSRNLYEMDVQVIEQKEGVDLIPRKVELPSQDTFSIGETVEASVRIHNVGTDATGDGFEVALSASPDRQVGNGNDVPLTPSTVSVESVAGGSSKDVTAEVELPSSLNAGDYYIVANVDPSGELSEVSTSNNTSFSRAIEIETRCYDPLEPNDSLSNARSVDGGDYNGLVACASSDDYYEICVDDGKKFSVSTQFNDDDGDIDMELYDQHFNVIDSSAQTGANQEEVSVDYVNGQQCYYARTFVLTTDKSLETTYDMNVDIQEVPPSKQCDSHFEPNDDFSTATSYIAGVEQTALLDRCPSSDTDYYRLELNRGQKVTLRGVLEPASQSGSLRLQLYKPNRQPTQNASTAPGVPTAELKDYVAPTSGTYFVQVTLSGSTRRLTYELEESGLGGLDLAASNLFFWQGEYSGGDSLKYQFDLSNRRADTANTPSYTIYLGDAKTLDTANDTKLDTVTHSDVQGNTTEQINDQVQLPQSVPSGTTRYIHVKVETNSNQTDPNPSNDVDTLAIDFK